MAANSVISPKRLPRHPTWLIPFTLLCIGAGVFGCLALMDRV